jgi:hypothetical protein
MISAGIRKITGNTYPWLTGRFFCCFTIQTPYEIVISSGLQKGL